jgi:hypothetical protein
LHLVTTFHFLLYIVGITLNLQSKKCKAFLTLAMKAYRGRRGNAPLNLNLVLFLLAIP